MWGSLHASLARVKKHLVKAVALPVVSTCAAAGTLWSDGAVPVVVLVIEAVGAVAVVRIAIVPVAVDVQEVDPLRGWPGSLVAPATVNVTTAASATANPTPHLTGVCGSCPPMTSCG